MWKSSALFACLGLAGCVAPPAVTYASFALDGASFVATGKSVSDHALSMAVAKDCAVWRAVTEQDVEAVCRDVAEDGEAGAAATFGIMAAIENLFLGIDPAKATVALRDGAPISAALTPAALTAAAGENHEAAYLVIGSARIIDHAKQPAGWVPDMAIAISAALTAAAPPATAGDNRQAVYLVIGSVRTIDGAERLADRVPDMATAIASALAGGEPYYRVVAGPYAPAETVVARARLTAAGIGNTWAANLCTRDLGAPPCAAPDAPIP